MNLQRLHNYAVAFTLLLGLISPAALHSSDIDWHSAINGGLQFGRNAAVLKGDVFGLGEHPNHELTKSIAFEKTSGTDGIEVEQALFTDAPRFDYDRLLFLTTNRTSEYYCEVFAEKMVALDAEGTRIGPKYSDIAFVLGESGLVGEMEKQNHNCLAPNTSAFATHQQFSDFRSIEKLQISKFRLSTKFNSKPTPEVVVPVSYTVAADDPREINIWVKNLSAVEVNVNYLDIIAIDEALGPLAYNFVVLNTDLGPNETTVASHRIKLLGKASVLYVRVGYLVLHRLESMLLKNK